jgi:hypothetical protein
MEFVVLYIKVFVLCFVGQCLSLFLIKLLVSSNFSFYSSDIVIIAINRNVFLLVYFGILIATMPSMNSIILLSILINTYQKLISLEL